MSRTAVVMQPTWLPYLGYFQLIAAADVFIFLDDVQFARRTWQSRNRILDHGHERMLEVRLRKQPLQTPISDILIDDDQPWRGEHLAAISGAYAHHPHFTDGYAFLEEQLAPRSDARLSGLNRIMIEAASRRMGLTTPFVLASDLACPGSRSEHVLALCRAVDASDYLSPTGAADYMEQDGVFAAADFPVHFHRFIERPYAQVGETSFKPFMGFIDAVMNVGWGGMATLIQP